MRALRTIITTYHPLYQYAIGPRSDTRIIYASVHAVQITPFVHTDGKNHYDLRPRLSGTLIVELNPVLHAWVEARRNRFLTNGCGDC